ncbi:MAG: hypothetical protein PF443_09285 [Allgaiera sp.]|jgi:hypothetical protein|nr:hypothetical protein [Allgaiera sp.]
MTAAYIGRKLPIRPLILIPVIVALAGCGNGMHGPRIGAADMADSATTAYALSHGFVEGNPILGGSAAPVVALAAKFAGKSILIAAGVKPQMANKAVETGSAFGACANIMTITGATPPIAVLAGMICAVAYFKGSKA